MRILALVVGVGCAVAFGGFAASAGPNDDLDVRGEIGELKEQISSLQDRVELLEKRLREGTIVIVDKPERPDDQSPRMPRQFRLPEHWRKGWQRREFNGIPYYVIPLGCDSAKPRSSAK